MQLNGKSYGLGVDSGAKYTNFCSTTVWTWLGRPALLPAKQHYTFQQQGIPYQFWASSIQRAHWIKLRQGALTSPLASRLWLSCKLEGHSPSHQWNECWVTRCHVTAPSRGRKLARWILSCYPKDTNHAGKQPSPSWVSIADWWRRWLISTLSRHLAKLALCCGPKRNK